MDFGKVYRAGNFEVLKIVRTMGKKDLARLRDMNGVPVDVRKHLRRGGLPYMTVQTVGGGWSICFVCGSTMYRFIEYEVMNGESGAHALHNLFTMMYCDTTILGDSEYTAAKSQALQAFVSRQQAKDVTEAEDGKVLEEEKEREAAKARIVDMVATELQQAEQEGGAHEG